MSSYLFDVKMFASFRVEAASEAEARVILASVLDGAEANFGCWPDGSPVLSTVAMDGEADLLEDDG